MKILIVGSPRSGSVYLYSVLAGYFMSDMAKDLILEEKKNLHNALHEPFGEWNSELEQKQKFEQIIKLPSWVVKIHASHIQDNNHAWITKLYKKADLIIKLERDDMRSIIHSHCIAETLDNYVENMDVNVEISEEICHHAITCAYDDRMFIKSVPYNIKINYRDLTTPDQILKHIFGNNFEVDMTKFKHVYIPRKNNATIKNIDQVNAWISIWLKKRKELYNHMPETFKDWQ